MLYTIDHTAGQIFGLYHSITPRPSKPRDGQENSANARDRKRHARAKEVPSEAPPAGAMSSPLHSGGHQTQIWLSLIKESNPRRQPTPQSQKLTRIRSCLQTVAILLETNHAYLPIFLRLEQELEAEQSKQDAIARSRTYLTSLF